MALSPNIAVYQTILSLIININSLLIFVINIEKSFIILDVLPMTKKVSFLKKDVL